MKQYLFALSILLTGCVTQQVKMDNLKDTPDFDMSKFESEYHVIAEICTTIPTDDSILKGNTVSREKIFSSGPYNAVLTGLSVDNKSIYRGIIARADNLTYLTVNTPTNHKYLFKRDYKKYTLNQWSKWEKPDSLVDDNYNVHDNNSHAFFWLATRNKNRTNELKKLSYNVEDAPKVRFKIMTYGQYYKENFSEYQKEKIVIEHNLPQCE